MLGLWFEDYIYMQSEKTENNEWFDKTNKQELPSLQNLPFQTEKYREKHYLTNRVK